MTNAYDLGRYRVGPDLRNASRDAWRFRRLMYGRPFVPLETGYGRRNDAGGWPPS